jgi:protein-S-isoprenylcysteine O-methyltransferase Ste14
MTTLRFRDLAERALLICFFSWLSWRVGSAVIAGETSWASLLMLAGELLVIVFLLLGRPASDMSQRPREWLLACAGSIAPLFVQPGGEALAPIWIIAPLFFIAIALQLAAKISINRSFGMVPANRGVVTEGLYRVVRHPVYASYLIGHVTFLLINPTLWNVAVYCVALALQIGRMLAEEGLLSRDPAYADYMQAVRYRLVPGVY